MTEREISFWQKRKNKEKWKLKGKREKREEEMSA